MSIRLYTNASSADRRVDLASQLAEREYMNLTERMDAAALIGELRPRLKRIAVHFYAHLHYYDVSYQCECGSGGSVSISEVNLYREGLGRFFCLVLEELDKAHTCADVAVMTLFYSILEVVSRCLYEEVVDDTMKRFSLLEFK